MINEAPNDLPPLGPRAPQGRWNDQATFFAWASHGKNPWAANDVQNVAFSHIHWIGLRENLQETLDIPIEYGFFLQIFP